MEQSSQYSCKLIGEETKYKGDFLALKHKYYSINKKGIESKIVWEAIDYSRPTNNFNFGVSIIPIIKNENKIIIIENYRYAIGKKCLEFPAGLINTNETELMNDIPSEDQNKEIEQIAINSARRELKEETGYEGVFKRFMTLPSVKNPINVLSNVYYDPWKSTDAGVMCLFEIDKNIPINQMPKQDLDECELIKTYEIKLDQLLDFISEKIKNEKIGCSTELYSFAMGIYFKDILN